MGLIFSILRLRDGEETGWGRRLAIAGIVIPVVSFAVGVVVLLSIMTAGHNPPIDESQQARPESTVVTVNPEVENLVATPPAAALPKDVAKLRGRTFVVRGTIDRDDPDMVAVLDPDGRRVVLRGTLVDDYGEGDDFTATVTVTTEKADALPVLTVSDIDQS